MSFFNDPTTPFLIALLVLLVVLIPIAVWGSVKERRERREKESKFVSLLLTAFENKAVATVNDVIALHNAHFDDRESPVVVYRHIQGALQAVQLQIATASVQGTAHTLIARLGELRELTDLVTKALAGEEKKVPFYGTPEPERGLLEDLLELTHSDKAIVGAKLTRLAELIVARNETITTLGEEKGAAKRLAIWGLAGTVLFGVLSIVVTVALTMR